MVKKNRHGHRVVVGIQGALNAGNRIVLCRVEDISETGARLRLSEEATILSENCTLSLSRNGPVLRRCRIVWQNKDALGVRFVVLHDGRARCAPGDRPHLAHDIAATA
jgi:hypothetical protein